MENENTNHEHHHHHDKRMDGNTNAWNIAKWILVILVILALLRFLFGGMMGRGMMGDRMFMKDGSGTEKQYKASPGKRILNIRKEEPVVTTSGETTTTVETTDAIAVPVN